MEYLTKPMQINTGKIVINLRILLNTRQKNLIIMVTDEKDSKRKVITNNPYHYNNFDNEESKIKEYLKTSLKEDIIKYTLQDIDNLINNLKHDMENNIRASENFPQNNLKSFLEIFRACQEENRRDSKETNSKTNFNDIKEHGRATTPQGIIREILIGKYQKQINKINNRKTKELVLDCEDFKVTVNGGQYFLTDILKHSPEEFLNLVKNELNNLTYEEVKSNLNPYKIKEDDELYYLRFKNLEETPLKDMLGDKVGRFTQIEGIVSGIYDPIPKLKKAVFECMSCMRLHKIDQDSYNDKVIEPSLCNGCGSRSFRLLKNESTNTTERYLLLTEPQEDLNLESTPRQLLVKLVGNNDFINKVNAGNRVTITGILDSVKEDKGKSNFVFMANNIEKLEDKTIILTPEDKEKCLKLCKREDLLDLLVKSFAPDLILPRELKEALLLFLAKSGKDENGLDMIHILIISDPATAKTRLKERVKEIGGKVVLVSGASASGVGITGAVVKDTITKNWIVVAGAIPLSNNGFCVIDEIDKMSKEETTKANNFMESGYEDFHKAGTNRTLIGKTSVLGLGNPRDGRYDRYKSLQDQVDIEPTFQSRYDLIFLIEDKADKNIDSQIIDSILNMYDTKDNENTTSDIKENTHEINILNSEDLKKYLAFARTEYDPKLTPEAKKCIKENSLKLRNNTEDGEAPYNWRFIRAIPKLAGAYAKLHLRTNITKEDVEKAIALKNYSVNLIGLDPFTGTIDNDRVTGNLNKEDKREREIIKKLIKEYLEDPNIDEDGIPANILIHNYLSRIGKSKSTYKRRLNELIKIGEVIKKGNTKNTKYTLKNY